MKFGRPVGALALALLLVTSVVAGAGIALADDSEVNHGADATPDPTLSATVEKDVHDTAWSSALTYEADDGSMKTLNGEVNSSVDNPYGFVASDLNFSDAGVFPSAKSDVSMLEAAEWSVDESGTAGSASVTDTRTAPDVEAVNLATSSQTSGDTATFTADNFSITSDEQKRHLQVVLDVNTLDSGASAEVQVVDEDGDMKVAEIDASRSSGEDLIANSTGEGIIYQTQLGDLSTEGSGDGDFNNIQRVDVVVSDANADVDISAINLERMSTWTFGTKLADTDSDDDLEEVDHVETREGGTLAIHDLDTVQFDDADIMGLTVDIRVNASDLGSEDVELNTTVDDGNTYPNFHGTTTLYYRFELPDAYELSFSDERLVDEQTVPESRVMSVEYAEDTGTTEFGQIDSWTDKTSLYSGEGTTAEIDYTIHSGQTAVLKYQFKLTESEFDAIQSSSSGGGGGVLASGGGGGVLDMLISLPGAAFGTFLAFLGLRKRRGGS